MILCQGVNYAPNSTLEESQTTQGAENILLTLQGCCVALLMFVKHFVHKNYYTVYNSNPIFIKL